MQNFKQTDDKYKLAKIQGHNATSQFWKKKRNGMSSEYDISFCMSNKLSKMETNILSNISPYFKGIIDKDKIKYQSDSRISSNILPDSFEWKTHRVRTLKEGKTLLRCSVRLWANFYISVIQGKFRNWTKSQTEGGYSFMS